MDEYLTQLYYNPKRSGALGGVERLYRDVKKDGKYDISRAQLKKWLMKQDTYTLHKPARRHYKKNRVIVGGIDELWQMDLADMQTMAAENDGYRYLLVCVDVFSSLPWLSLEAPEVHLLRHFLVVLGGLEVLEDLLDHLYLLDFGNGL